MTTTAPIGLSAPDSVALVDVPSQNTTTAKSGLLTPQQLSAPLYAKQNLPLATKAGSNETQRPSEFTGLYGLEVKSSKPVLLAQSQAEPDMRDALSEAFGGRIPNEFLEPGTGELNSTAGAAIDAAQRLLQQEVGERSIPLRAIAWQVASSYWTEQGDVQQATAAQNHVGALMQGLRAEAAQQRAQNQETQRVSMQLQQQSTRYESLLNQIRAVTSNPNFSTADIEALRVTVGDTPMPLGQFLQALPQDPDGQLQAMQLRAQFAQQYLESLQAPLPRPVTEFLATVPAERQTAWQQQLAVTPLTEVVTQLYRAAPGTALSVERVDAAVNAQTPAIRPPVLDMNAPIAPQLSGQALELRYTNEAHLRNQISQVMRFSFREDVVMPVVLRSLDNSVRIEIGRDPVSRNYLVHDLSANQQTMPLPVADWNNTVDQALNMLRSKNLTADAGSLLVTLGPEHATSPHTQDVQAFYLTRSRADALLQSIRTQPRQESLNGTLPVAVVRQLIERAGNDQLRGGGSLAERLKSLSVAPVDRVMEPEATIGLTVNEISGQDMRGQDLSNQSYETYQFHHVNLSSANLQGANFSYARLEQVDLRGANLNGTNFYDASLESVDLSNTSFPNANFQDAQISASNLSNSQLPRNMASANISAHSDLQFVDLQGADLRRTFITESDLSGSNLSGADMRSGYFLDSNFYGVNLSGANLRSLPALETLALNPNSVPSATNLQVRNLITANLDNVQWDRSIALPLPNRTIQELQRLMQEGMLSSTMLTRVLHNLDTHPWFQNVREMLPQHPDLQQLIQQRRDELRNADAGTAASTPQEPQQEQPGTTSSIPGDSPQVPDVNANDGGYIQRPDPLPPLQRPTPGTPLPPEVIPPPPQPRPEFNPNDINTPGPQPGDEGTNPNIHAQLPERFPLYGAGDPNYPFTQQGQKDANWQRLWDQDFQQQGQVRNTQRTADHPAQSVISALQTSRNPEALVLQLAQRPGAAELGQLIGSRAGVQALLQQPALFDAVLRALSRNGNSALLQTWRTDALLMQIAKDGRTPAHLQTLATQYQAKVGNVLLQREVAAARLQASMNRPSNFSADLQTQQVGTDAWQQLVKDVEGLRQLLSTKFTPQQVQKFVAQLVARLGEQIKALIQMIGRVAGAEPAWMGLARSALGALEAARDALTNPELAEQVKKGAQNAAEKALEITLLPLALLAALYQMLGGGQYQGA